MFRALAELDTREHVRRKQNVGVSSSAASTGAAVPEAVLPPPAPAEAPPPAP